MTMAYVVKGKGARWELRASRWTAAGPRSRTLATFEQLDDGAFVRAEQRLGAPLDRVEVERAARRVGAPVCGPAPERAARELLASLKCDDTPRPAIVRLLQAAIGAVPTGPLSDAAKSAGEWAATGYPERAAALVDLLLLADAIPPPKTERAERFPRFSSAAPAA